MTRFIPVLTFSFIAAAGFSTLLKAQPSLPSSGPFSREAGDSFPRATGTPSDVRMLFPGEDGAVFFPPAAPIYGAPLATRSPSPLTINGRPIEPPDNLGKYVGEFFYPPLSSRLLARQLDKKVARQLEAYEARRASLLTDLQNTLVVLEAADAATRARDLSALAVVQAPQLAAHEKDAEELRQKLIEGGLLLHPVDWSRDREWRLGDPTTTRFAPDSAELQVIRAAAYYQAELLPEQRGLLCEIVEQKRRFRGMPNSRNLAPVFFSPETARLVPPDDLPADLTAKFSSYVRLKDALKEELRQAVVANDSATPKKRTAEFHKLAEAQWPRLVELAHLADEIRRELVALPAPVPPPLPPRLPPDLAARIETWRKEQTTLNAERRQRANEVNAKSLFLNSESRGKIDREAFGKLIAQRRNELQEADEAFSRDNTARYQALEEAGKKLSADLQQFAKAHLDPVTGDPMDMKVLLARMSASDRYFEKIAREEVLYKFYRIAMLEPGLSPEQRRLLFNAARVELAQPLPPAETFPRGRVPFPFL